ncbi:C45 family autoproteolytic acyltransferase/hydolase [Rhizobium azibense]|nr:C45 family peptidase [Rhizobium azibense]
MSQSAWTATLPPECRVDMCTVCLTFAPLKIAYYGRMADISHNMGVICSVIRVFMSRRLPIVVLYGSPFERGRQHGSLFSSPIRVAVNSLREKVGQAGWSAAEKVAGASWTYLQSHQPQIVAEIEGIAAGAGFSPLEIYCLNGFEFFDEPAAKGCTSVAVSTSAGAVVGQNWDAPVGTEEQLVLISYCERGLQCTMVTSPGTLGWVGFNSCGFAFVTNDLMMDRSATGIPSLVARRLIIRQRRVGDAIAVLRSIDHMGGRCYLFGDETGSVGGVEISPKAGVVSLEGPAIVHTNHPLTAPVLPHENVDVAAAVYPSSQARLLALNRLRPLLDGKAGVQRALSDTSGAPDAICKSFSVSEPTQTAFSFVFDCRSMEAALSIGRPAANAYHDYAAGNPIRRHADVRSA